MLREAPEVLRYLEEEPHLGKIVASLPSEWRSGSESLGLGEEYVVCGQFQRSVGK
jgi:hypothetical protein